ncbi:MAG: alkaline phosphatase, partial [Planctomycetota bacterium]|nr:alkaline phosphatase [Planctomycetota bacterium]
MFEQLPVVVVSLACTAFAAWAQPVVTRLVPPSKIFSQHKQQGPVIARFLPGQRFDLQATVDVGPGNQLTKVEFLVDGVNVGVATVFASATATPAASDWVASRRAYSCENPGERRLTVRATDSAGGVATAEGSFEVVSVVAHERKAKNLIIMIGDGMGLAHRTAARIMKNGVTYGKSDGLLEMDQLGHTALVTTHSLNSIVTDSSPGAAAYSTGNKCNNQQHGVFPDDTNAAFDNPRVENIAEYLWRTQGKVLGLVTTADVADATPSAFASHTQNRAAGTGVCDQFFDERESRGLRVLMGGGRKWFLPQDIPGSTRATSNDGDYRLPDDVVEGWKVPPGQIDPDRDLLAAFEKDGYAYAADRTSLMAMPAGTQRILGLFNFSNMNVSLDKIAGRRGTSTLVNDYGFPDQPMLEEMTSRALEALVLNDAGFVLMVEGASIDKQSQHG